MTARPHIKALQAVAQTPADDGLGEPSEPPQRLSIVIVEEAGDWSHFGSVAAAIEAAAAVLQRHPTAGISGLMDATIALADDRRVQDLNRDFRGLNTPTNVLSFPSAGQLETASPRYLGDIILAAETVMREAADLGILPVDHLQHLVLHGLLHLLGYDHETDADADRMERLETELLATLGVADPYADSDPLPRPLVAAPGHSK